MRIAIDATAAVRQRAGVGRYTSELLRALLATAPPDERYTLLAAGGDQAGTLRALGAMPPHRVRTIPADDRLVTALWQRARVPLPADWLAGPFDVFHGPDFVLPPLRKAGVVTIHDLTFRLHPEYSEPALARYLNAAVPRAFASATRIIAVSASVAREIVEVFPGVRERVVAIPNGVWLPGASFARAPAERPTLLIVGTIEPRKNHLRLLEAVRLLRGRYRDLQLIVAGRVGWRADEIARALHAAAADGLVDWHADADDVMLDALYAAATVAVVPSHAEGFGLPLLEALARGVPTVANDIPVLREVAGDAARYVDCRDTEALAEALGALLDDAAAQQALAVASRVQASRFSWQETARRTRRVYADAAREGS